MYESLEGSTFKVQWFKGSRVQRFMGSRVQGFKRFRVRGSTVRVPVSTRTMNLLNLGTLNLEP
jgi:hypothetical protein